MSMLEQHPLADRFVAAAEAGGWQIGEQLPYHTTACFGCGPDNAAGLGLSARVAEEGVEAQHVFDARQRGAPGLAHGGAISGIFDDLFGMVLLRDMIVAVTVDLRVRYRRAVHLDEPCRLTARVIDAGEREIELIGELVQHDEVKVTGEATFRRIASERLTNRYAPVEDG